MDVSPSDGEPRNVLEVALLEVRGGKTAYLDMVARHTGNGYVGSACGEINDGYASSHEGAYAFAGCFVAAQCGDYSVAVPCEWVVSEAILYHQVPAVFACIARNTAHTGGAHWGDHHKNIFTHVLKYITARMRYASLRFEYAIEIDVGWWYYTWS